MKRTQVVMECDICGSIQPLPNPKAQAPDVDGLTFGRSFYHDGTMGGQIKDKTFVCDDCINGTSDGGPGVPLTLRDLINVVLFAEPYKSEALRAVR